MYNFIKNIIFVSFQEYDLDRPSGEHEANHLETVIVNDQIDLDNILKTTSLLENKQMFDNVENPQNVHNIFSDESWTSNLCEQNQYIPNVKKPDIEYSQRLKNLAKIVCQELATGILDDENTKDEILNEYEELKLNKPSYSLLTSDSNLSNRFEASDNEQSSRETNSRMKEKYNYITKKKKKEHLDFKRIHCYKWISCINNYNSKKTYEPLINNVSEDKPNVCVSQSHSPPIKLREVKSSLSDSLKQKMLHTDKTLDLLKEENIYYQHTNLKLDQKQKGNLSDSFLGIKYRYFSFWKLI